MAVLEATDLGVSYRTRRGPARALEHATFKLEPGQVFGVVGESGCGKTTMGMALMGLLPESATMTGSVRLEGRDIADLTADEWRRIRGKDIAMIFQGAMNAWNPVYTVGDQIIEAILAHEPELGRRAADDRVVTLFEKVGLPADARSNFPHEYSGGMKQRAVIAMALACGPKVLVADEPTTALDVIVQHQILQELRTIRSEHDLAMLYISHDMAVVAELADSMAVMYAGQIVETGKVADIFAGPAHPYTAALLKASPALHGPKHEVHGLSGAPPDLVHPPAGCRFAPRCSRATDKCTDAAPLLTPQRASLKAACWFPVVSQSAAAANAHAATTTKPAGASDSAPVVRIEGATQIFTSGHRFLTGTRHTVRAVDDVTIDIAPGEAFGLVGGSGSGKTTLGRMLARLGRRSGGSIRFRIDGESRDIDTLDRLTLRRNVQMIFQDPYESLNPRMTIGEIVAEPLDVLGIGSRESRNEKVEALIERVGLAPPSRFVRRYPHEVSGGQRQRIAIARAMIVDPKFVVADEPTSMLDVSVRAGIMDLLLDLKRDLGLAFLYITHDLAVARYLCERIAVMYRGKIVEHGPTEDVLANPLHPYTRALIAAVPEPDPGRSRAEPEIRTGAGEVSDSRCRFLAQCPLANERCTASPHPGLDELLPQHFVACYLAMADGTVGNEQEPISA